MRLSQNAFACGKTSLMKILRQDRSVFNCIFVHSELDDLGLDPHEFRIYAHLARRANGKTKAWPGITSMSESCRMKRNTVIRVIRQLEERRLIRVIRKSGGLSEYLLTSPSEWKKNSEISTSSDTSIPNGTGTGLDTGISNGTGSVLDTGAVSQRTLPPVPFGILKGNPSEGNPLKDNTADGLSASRDVVQQIDSVRDGNRSQNNHTKSSQSPIKRKAYAIAELLQFQHWDNCKVSFVKETARAYAEKALRDGHDEQIILKAYEIALRYCHGVVTDGICRDKRRQHEKASPALTVWLAHQRLSGDPRTIEQRWQEIISKLTAEKQKIHREITEKSPEINAWFSNKTDRGMNMNSSVSSHETEPHTVTA